ncbi:MAG: hypothetical protein HYX72_14495 [Acidobacteria bacterium]|nr:hypothetical protein [Acidobacteriota bacterium]
MKILLLTLKLFPLLLSAVRAVEDAIPLPGQGKRKLGLVLDILKSAYDTGDELLREFPWQRVVQIAEPMVARIVLSLNELGVFKKSAPEPAQ